MEVKFKGRTIRKGKVVEKKSCKEVKKKNSSRVNCTVGLTNNLPEGHLGSIFVMDSGCQKPVQKNPYG